MGFLAALPVLSTNLTFHLVSIFHTKLCLEKGLGRMGSADQGNWLVPEATGRRPLPAKPPVLGFLLRQTQH